LRFAATILSISVVLAGCSDDSAKSWHDVSGKERNSKLAAHDQDECFRSEAPTLAKSGATEAGTRAVLDRVQACMKQLGWEMG